MITNSVEVDGCKIFQFPKAGKPTEEVLAGHLKRAFDGGRYIFGYVTGDGGYATAVGEELNSIDMNYLTTILSERAKERIE